MKNFSVFVFVVYLLLILTTIFSLPITANNYKKSHPSTPLSRIPTDSNNQDFIFYRTGHHGYVWSKVYRDTSGLLLSNGTTRNWNDQQTWQPFDTLRFIERNTPTIIWGLDSLWKEAKQLKPLSKQTYNPIYTELYIIRNNDTLFTLGDAEKFLGKDSEIFNPKLQKLMFLMLWLASPSIREYLPTPNDTIQTKAPPQM
ncbi:hypothetical protein [uncultured Duncaniella sp.]|uniref:hypothetical protein n=1 Tax=uncultured Duncaniella sp. TaxID=2768039 RepID=UPI0025AA10C9|nr:hypothetical protein [uncultured Duncaniella sp.]